MGSKLRHGICETMAIEHDSRQQVPKDLNEAAEVDDFELWYYHLIHDNRCFFDNRPAQHWYHKLGFGPLVEGFHVNDHFNVNTKLEAFSSARTGSCCET